MNKERGIRSTAARGLLILVLLVPVATPILMAQLGSVVGDGPASNAGYRSMSPGPNSIINGNFETGTFYGWMNVHGADICDVDDIIHPYEGSYCGLISGEGGSFYQQLSYVIVYGSRFKGAMYALVLYSDSDWHETQLTITKTGLATIHLHYRLQTNQPPDTATDKYFLVGRGTYTWYAWNRSLSDDLVSKGISQYLGGEVTEVSCHQGGIWLGAFDALVLSSSIARPVPQLSWSYATGGCVRSSPAIADIDGDGKLEIIIGSDDYSVYCLNETGALKWNYTTADKVSSTAAIADVNGDGKPEIVFGSYDHRVYCLNATGGLVWNYTTRGSVESSPAITDLNGDGRKEIVIGSDDGKVYCLNSTGNSVWNYTTGGPLYSSPRLEDIDADGNKEVIIASADFNIYCLDKTGGLKWKYGVASAFYASPAIADVNGDGKREIVDQSYDSVVFCWDGTGRSLWVSSFPPFCKSSPVVADIDGNLWNEVLTGSSNRTWCLNRYGIPIWSYETGRLESSPLVADVDRDGSLEVSVGSDDHVIYCLSSIGKVEWNYTTGGAVVSSPTVADLNRDNITDLVIGSNDSKVYCLSIVPVPLPVGALVIWVKSSSGSNQLVGAGVFSSSQPEFQPPLVGVTDSNGKAYFDDIVAGTYMLFANASGYMTSWWSVTVVANSTSTYQFLLTPINSSGSSSSDLWSVVGIVGILFFMILLTAIWKRGKGSRDAEGEIATEPEGLAMEPVEETGTRRAEAEPCERREEVGPGELHEHLITRPSSNTCPYCGVSLTRPDSLFCWNCGAAIAEPSALDAVIGGEKKKALRKIGKCIVCNLEVETDDATLWCPYCGNVAHKTHMLEWLHVKDYCPVCRQHLDEKDLKDQPTKRRPKKRGSPKRRS